jgi:PhzF family phenazine biosynthesis protein
MPARRFKQVDVFTTQPYRGNPVAVILDAEGLRAEDMQQIAAWTNLSETTFVLPPTQAGADYRLRIFDPVGEVPFAGHPTLGSAHAILESEWLRPKAGRMMQECGAGLLPLRIETGDPAPRIFVRVPQPRITPLPAAAIEQLCAALGSRIAATAPLEVNVGPVWLVTQLPDEDAVHALRPDMAAVTRLSHALHATGVIAFALTGRAPYQVYTRAFAPAVGVSEDPVCGSGNASVAAFLAHCDLLTVTGLTYTAQQGYEVGRCGVIAVCVDPADRSIEIGGSCVTCVDGLRRGPA